MQRVLVAIVGCCLLAAAGSTGEMKKTKASIDRVLTSLHRAAADADGDLYFSLFAEDLVFMGTDADERWSVGELRAFAEPYFSRGRGWTYTMTDRHISLAADGQTAWFDEMLWNESYGRCRGTGVLVFVDGAWQITQYSLSIPMPNALAAEFTARIREVEGEKVR